MKKAKDQPGSEPAELASLVGERIRKIRKEEGLSLELFALRCDMNAAYVGHIERDVQNPTLNTLERICKGLDISVEDLFIDMLFTDVQRSVRLNKKKKSTNTSPYPDEVIDRLARAFYPPSLPAGTARRAIGHLSGRGPSILLRKTVRSLKSPTGAFIAALRFANASLPMAGRAGSSHPQQRKTERSRRGTPCCTYRYRLWL